MRISKKIIAIVLSVLMAVSMMPFTAFAATTVDVASGAELKTAVANAESGDTIRFTNSFTMTAAQVGFKVDKDLTFDLNGQTISGPANGSIGTAVDPLNKTEVMFVTGTSKVTFQDSVGGGSWTYSYPGNSAAYLVDARDNSVITVNSGTYTCQNANYAGVLFYLRNSAKLIINDGTFNAESGSTRRDAIAWGGSSSNYIEINDGTFNAAKSSDYTINANSATATINGGTYNGTVSGSAGKLVVNGGEFKAYDGTTTKDMTTYLAADVVQNENGEVVSVDSSTVVKIGNQQFTSFADALDYAYANTGSTLTFLADVTDTTKGIDVPEGLKITFDLNGHTLTANKMVGSTGTVTNAMRFLKDSVVEMKNGTLTTTNESCMAFIQDYSKTLTLRDVNIVVDTAKFKTSGQHFGISSNYGTTYLYGNTNITLPMNQTGNNVAIDVCYWNNSAYGEGTTTLSLGTTYTGTISFAPGKYTGKNCIAVNYHGIDAAGKTLTAGTWEDHAKVTINSANANIEGRIVEYTDDNNITIKAGSFTVDVTEYTPDGYAALINDGTGKYVVQATDSVATVNGVAFDSMDEAFAAAAASTDAKVTIALLKDATFQNVATFNNGTKTVVINFNGYTLTADVNNQSGANGAHIKVYPGTTLTLSGAGNFVTANTPAAYSGSLVKIYGADTSSGAASKVALDAYASVNLTSAGYGITLFPAAGTNSAYKATISIPATYKGTIYATDGDASAIAVSGNVKEGNSAINIYGGTVKGNDVNGVGIYAGGMATWTIGNSSNPTIEGATGIYQKCGTVKVTGVATIKGNGAKTPYKYYGNGFVATGDAYVIENCGYPAGVPVSSITNGTFISEYAEAVASYVKQDDATQTGDYEQVKGFITKTSKAVFSTDASDYAVDGYYTAYDAAKGGYAIAAATKPTATVADLDVSTLKNLDYYNKNTGAADTGLSLDVGYEFTPNVTPAQAGKYATYFADFVISADNDVPAGAITIAGNYGSYGWHAITNTEAIPAGTQVRLLATFLGEDAMTYADVYDIVQDFKCGIKLNDASIAGTNVTVDLRLFETTNTGTAAEPVYEEVVGGESFSAEDVVYELQPAAEDFATLSVGSKIALNFHIAAAAHNADKVVVSAVNNTKEDNTKYDTTYTDVANVEDYVVSVGLAPAQIKETIHVAIYSGSTVVAEYDYSVYNYCKDIIADANYPVTVKNLVKAFVNYAAAAQKAVEWNQTGALAVADSELYTDVTQATPVFNASASAITGATINSASVICLNETSVRFYYDGTIDSATVSGIEGAQVVIYDDAIDVTGIPADKIGTPFTLTINGTSITYSVDSWNAVALRYFDSTNANYGLAQALANYGAAANAYFV